MLVSEELATDKDFLRIIYGTVKDREIKRSTQLVVTKEKVADFLKKKGRRRMNSMPENWKLKGRRIKQNSLDLPYFWKGEW